MNISVNTASRGLNHANQQKLITQLLHAHCGSDDTVWKDLIATSGIANLASLIQTGERIPTTILTSLGVKTEFLHGSHDIFGLPIQSGFPVIPAFYIKGDATIANRLATAIKLFIEPKNTQEFFEWLSAIVGPKTMPSPERLHGFLSGKGGLPRALLLKVLDTLGKDNFCPPLTEKNLFDPEMPIALTDDDTPAPADPSEEELAEIEANAAASEPEPATEPESEAVPTDDAPGPADVQANAPGTETPDEPDAPAPESSPAPASATPSASGTLSDEEEILNIAITDTVRFGMVIDSIISPDTTLTKGNLARRFKKAGLTCGYPNNLVSALKGRYKINWKKEHITETLAYLNTPAEVFLAKLSAIPAQQSTEPEQPHQPAAEGTTETATLAQPQAPANDTATDDTTEPPATSEANVTTETLNETPDDTIAEAISETAPETAPEAAPALPVTDEEHEHPGLQHPNDPVETWDTAPQSPEQSGRPHVAQPAQVQESLSGKELGMLDMVWEQFAEIPVDRRADELADIIREMKEDIDPEIIAESLSQLLSQHVRQSVGHKRRRVLKTLFSRSLP